MPAYSVARRAESDLKSIARYTQKNWGHTQARRYLEDLHTCFQTLAKRPGMGRDCASILPGLKRFEHGRHVIFYVPSEAGVLIARVLHDEMVPVRSRFRS